MDRSINERLLQKEGSVIGEKSGREIVRTIQDDVVVFRDLSRVLRSEEDRMKIKGNEGIEYAEPGGGAV